MNCQTPPSPSPARFAATLRASLAAAALTVTATAQLRFAEHGGAMLPNKHDGELTEINAITSADFDGDGDLDLLFASNSGWGNVAHRVLLQDQFGNFHQTSVLQTYESAVSVAVGDVDGDGDIDLLFGGGRTAYQGPSEPRLLLNDGSAQFTASTTTPAPYHATADVALVDIDGDQDLDAVLFDHVWSSNAIIHVWQNDGTGTFTDITSHAIPTPTAGNRRGLVGDFDGDQDPDLVFEEWGTVKLLRNDGTGTFLEVPGWWTGSGSLLTAADMTGDGKPEIVTTTGVYAVSGQGTITLVRSGNFPVAHATAADFDGDGNKDIAGVTDDPVTTRLWLDQNGTFVDVTDTWLPPHTQNDFQLDYSFGAVHSADVDGDGDPDLLTGGVEGRSQSSTTVGIPPQLLINTGGAGFVDAARPAFPHVQNQLEGIACGDFDGDGTPDLMAGGTWLQDAGGRFDLASPSVDAVGAQVRMGDLDGDGDLDVITNQTYVSQGYALPRALSFGANDGNGNFTYTTLIQNAGLGFDVGDVDGDGDADLVASHPTMGVTLFQNDGNGNFQEAPQQMPAGAFDPDSVTLHDLDGDGDLDIVIAASLAWWATPAPAPILVYRNDGSGAFTDDTQNLPPMTVNHRLLVLDIDGDDDPDILVSGTDLINDGSGQFTAVVAGGNRFPDLDGDGLPETVTFGNGLTVGGISYPWCWGADCIAYPADVDGDDDLDLVVSSHEYASFHWSLYHTGILYNLHRDLQFTSLPRLGGTCRLSARATNDGGATAVLIVVGLGLLPQPVTIGSWGRMHLDPALSAPLATVTVPDEDTAADATLSIPADPSLVGISLSSQGLFLPFGDPAGVHLSAVITEALLP